MQRFAALLFLLGSALAPAQDAADGQSFNDAWEAYAEAARSDDVNAAVITAKAALDTGRSIFPETDGRIAALTHNYGRALLASGEKGAARVQLETAVVLFEALDGEDSIKLVPTLQDLADANAKAREEDTQLRIYKRALKITKTQHGSDSLEYAEVEYRAAYKMYSLSKSVRGEKYARHARGFFARRFGHSDQRTGKANLVLGKIQFSRGRHGEMVEYLEEALASFTGETNSDKGYRLVINALLVRGYEALGESDMATEHCVAIGEDTRLSDNQDYLPIFRMAPRYPVEMLKARREGYVDIKLTVDAAGFVQDPTVLFSTGSELFEKAALAAVEQFRYAPRFVDGKPVPTEGVKTRVSFRIKD